MKSKSEAALLIVGHGSTENPDSSEPYYLHAEGVREMGVFKEVHTCFWKEEPSMREAYYMIDASEIYVVPDFISEGYFTQEVIPRELELEGDTTLVHGKTVHYCAPVGIHPSMTDLILNQAQAVAPDIPPEETTLFIVGHGTSLNKNSVKSIQEQVTRIQEGEMKYAEVYDTYMEQEPLISNWAEMAKTPYVVVVPFFIADGLHSYQDIPVLLGFEKEEGEAASKKEVFRSNPYHLQGKTLYYSAAIGTGKEMAQVILEQVETFGQVQKEKGGAHV